MKHIIAQGAEAIIYLDEGTIVKERIPKPYRYPAIDNQLRKQRTRREAKLLVKAGSSAPHVHSVDEQTTSILMDHIQGDLLRDTLDTFDEKKRVHVMKTVGTVIGGLHAKDIVHGDITTSNLMLTDDHISIIDFGLGFVSNKTEDKAVDLYLFYHALESKHYTHYESLFDSFLAGYKTYKDHKAVLARLDNVGKRGRYKRKTKKI